MANNAADQSTMNACAAKDGPRLTAVLKGPETPRTLLSPSAMPFNIALSASDDEKKALYKEKQEKAVNASITTLELITIVNMSSWKKRSIIHGLIVCVHMRNCAVMQSWPRKKLKNLNPSMISSSRSSQSLHLVELNDSQERSIENERTNDAIGACSFLTLAFSASTGSGSLVMWQMRDVNKLLAADWPDSIDS